MANLKEDLNKQPLTVGTLIDLGVVMHSARAFGDSSQVPAGITYLGQFITHDISHIEGNDKLSDGHNTPTASISRIAPTLNLSSLYGAGPNDPKAPSYSNTGKMQLRHVGDDDDRPLEDELFDLPRDCDKKALIPDHRNDENLLIAQLHMLFLRLHNKLVDHYTGSPSQKYRQARECVTYLYREVIKQDFLKTLLDGEVWNFFFSGKQNFSNYAPVFCKPRGGILRKLPAEFVGAAFRFGHSMVRAEYNLRSNTPEATKQIELFQYTGKGKLNNKRFLPKRKVVEWDRFFPLAGKTSNQRAGLIRPCVKVEIPGFEWPSSILAVRNLMRGRSLKVRTGQQSVRRLNNFNYIKVVKELARTERNPRVILSDGTSTNFLTRTGRKNVLLQHTPLWFYLLCEANTGKHQARGLGKLGSFIVAETFHYLLQQDPVTATPPNVLSKTISMRKIVDYV